jgi:hypothetical protein
VCALSNIGAWLSLVERQFWELDVARSNRVAPTIFFFSSWSLSHPLCYQCFALTGAFGAEFCTDFELDGPIYQSAKLIACFCQTDWSVWWLEAGKYGCPMIFLVVVQ